MTIGKNSIVVGNFPDAVPDDHACINLKAFSNLDNQPAILGPAGDSGICICVFKVPGVPPWPEAGAKGIGAREAAHRTEHILKALENQINWMVNTAFQPNRPGWSQEGVKP